MFENDINYRGAYGHKSLEYWDEYVARTVSEYRFYNKFISFVNFIFNKDSRLSKNELVEKINELTNSN